VQNTLRENRSALPSPARPLVILALFALPWITPRIDNAHEDALDNVSYAKKSAQRAQTFLALSNQVLSYCFF
jgi:hypothetical protein